MNNEEKWYLLGAGGRGGVEGQQNLEALKKDPGSKTARGKSSALGRHVAERSGHKRHRRVEVRELLKERKKKEPVMEVHRQTLVQNRCPHHRWLHHSARYR